MSEFAGFVKSYRSQGVVQSGRSRHPDIRMSDERLAGPSFSAEFSRILALTAWDRAEHSGRALSVGAAASLSPDCMPTGRSSKRRPVIRLDDIGQPCRVDPKPAQCKALTG
jgi:hypothetical protein